MPGYFPFQAWGSWDPLGLNPNQDSLDGIEEINHYAMFMGYGSKAIRGLRFLVLTWTTVVLLGGFVSLLQKKDFWALTVITLVQTAGVFNVSPKKRLKNVKDSFVGLLVSMIRTDAGSGTAAALVAATVLQVLFVAVLLLPLGAIYVFGLYISTGISLWRLVQRDYGAASGDPSTANLTPALDILYVLPLVQGALLCYRAIFSVSKREHAVVNRVLARYELDEDEGRSVWVYFREIMAGCQKDPSFARGRNLITHAAALLASTSPETYLSGARLLDALLGRVSYGPPVDAHAHGVQRPRLCSVVAKALLQSASGTELIWKLLRTLDSKAQYDETARAQAASILVHLGGYIHLEQFPGAMQCIAPMLEPTEPVRNTVPLVPRPEMVQGMRILQSLASNSGNVVAIIGNPGLMANITALLHLHDDALAVQLSLGSLVLLRWLFGSLEESTPSMRQTVIKEYNTVLTLIGATESILMCDKCSDSFQKEAIKTLPYLLLSQDIIDPSETKKKFITILMDVFLRGRKNYSRELAGEKLAILSSELDAPVVFDRVDNFVARLRGILADDVRDSEYWCRIQAARILKNLCSHSSSDCPSSYLQTLKEAMVHAVPQVLREMLDIHMGLQAVTETYGGRFSATTGTDTGEGVGGPPDQQQQQALLSECAAACDKLVATDQDLAHRLDFIAAQICSEAGQPVRSWEDLVRQAREIVMDPSFARGRSLIRYAMDMMASTSSESYLVGAEILDTLLGRCSYEKFSDIEREQRPWLCRYVGNMVTASNEQLIANLVLMRGPTVVPHDEEARARAARILEHIVGYSGLSKIQLQDITVLLESLSSTPRWEEVLPGMRILRKLTAGRSNAERISMIPDLLAKITTLLNYHRFLGPTHPDNAWSVSAWESLVLIRRVLDGNLRTSATRNLYKIIRATKGMLMCKRCDDPLQNEAMRMHAQICWDNKDSYPIPRMFAHLRRCRKESIAILIDVLARGKKSHAKEMAGKNLEKASRRIPVTDDAIARLKRILVDAGKYQCRIQAARILKNLCITHPWAARVPRKALTDAVPKVLREMLNIQMELQQAATLPCGEGLAAPDIDLEQGRLSQGVPRPDPQQQRDTIELQDALLSECARACEKLVAQNQGLAPRLDKIAAQICSEVGKPVRSWGALITEARDVFKQQKEALLH